jgi:phosphoribosyl 1,2-cyclic phosphodiesterase
MPLQFSVLASGSRGNTTLVKAGGAGLLVDFGLGPRALEGRLASVGSSWDDVGAVVLTHTHGDHVDGGTLGRLVKRGIPLYCHEGHLGRLRRFDHQAALEERGLLKTYDDRPFLTSQGLRVEPIELSHDGGPTFGFRIEGRPERRARPVSLGYLADTGVWSPATVDAVAEVDVLGVEFNHDVDLQRQSGRAAYLIARNLGSRGHLSNAQGAALVEAVLGRSRSGGLQHVVLLHLSQQCNHPTLALTAARSAVRASGRRIAVHAAEQAVASPSLLVSARRSRVRRVRPEMLEIPF